MAHNCPECGALCHCGGDIDDILWGDDSDEAMTCTHFLKCEDYSDEPDDWPDDWPDEDV